MSNAREKRPSPEALLELAERERRGKLKVFLGASPGVGKTYAMLSGAQRLRGEGRDVVIGIVETHGRAETAVLLEGLEVLPRKATSYRGRTLLEFDIDGALKRRPSLIVVDELAHTNVPDSRHPKRYQDVEELLRAGIDVWTAMNIQHVESLTDVVSTITGVKVRELVPDTVIEKADDVVVVDITPDELIQRLKEGKVYLPENARRAEQNFLKPGNLTALRELALRRTAERVDDQMVSFLRQNAIEGPWPTAERILVCVGADSQSEAVVRIAARLATGLNASWIAVHLAVPGSEPHDAGSLKRIDDALALAQRLGGETTRLSARDLPSEVHRFALRQNITLIVIGRSRSGWLKRLLRRSLSDEIVRQARGIGVHVVTGDELAIAPFLAPAQSHADRHRSCSTCGRHCPRGGYGREPVAGAAQSLDDFPDRGAVLCRDLRRLERHHRGGAVIRRLQLLLHRAGLHADGSEPARASGTGHFSARCGVDRWPGGPRARAVDVRPGPRQADPDPV